MASGRQNMEYAHTYVKNKGDKKRSMRTPLYPFEYYDLLAKHKQEEQFKGKTLTFLFKDMYFCIFSGDLLFRAYKAAFTRNYKKPIIFFESDRDPEGIELPEFIGAYKDVTTNEKFSLQKTLKFGIAT